MSDKQMPEESASQSSPLAADDRLATQSNLESAAIAASTIKTVTTTPPVISSALPKKSPLEHARGLANEFLQTLRFPSQRFEYERRANEFIELYAEYYCESKNIFKAEKERLRLGTKHCGCFFNFQPRERVREGQAYQSLAGESDEIISTTLDKLGDLYLRGLKLNNGDRKNMLIEILSASLASFATFVLIECGLDTDYEPHDLVADLLLRHHKELLESKTTVQYFTKIYRQVNNCGHQPLCGQKLFDYRFPPDAENKSADKAEDPTTTSQQPNPTSAVTPSTTTPLVARNLQSALAAVGAANTGIAGTSFVNANQVTALQNALAVLNSFATESTTAAKSTTNSTPGSPPSLIIPPYAGAKPFFNKNTDSEDQEMIDLVERTLDEEKKKKETENRAEALRKTRLLECNIMVCIDSIRSKSTLGLPPTPPTAPPDTNPPPSFPNQTDFVATEKTSYDAANEAQPQPASSDTTATSNTQSCAVDNAPPPNGQNTVDSRAAVDKLWTAVERLFIAAPSVYITQYRYNQMALKMASASKEALSKHADKTAEVIVLDGGPDGKIEQEITAAKASKAKRKLKSDQNDYKNQLEAAMVEASRMKVLLSQEKSKRIKLEAKLKTSPPSSSVKETRGPATGATKKNQSGQALKKSTSNRNAQGKHRHTTAGDASNEGSTETESKRKHRNRQYWRKKKDSKTKRSNQNSP
jgi:hypothetical protein